MACVAVSAVVCRSALHRHAVRRAVLRFVNRAEPLVLGMPLVLGWTVMWIVSTSAIVRVVYRRDPVDRASDDADAASRS